MRCCSVIRNNPNFVIYLVSWSLFLLCSFGLFCLGYQCIEKYLAYPKAIDISGPENHHFFHRLAFTFEPMNPSKFFNMTNLKKCGIDSEKFYQDGTFIGKGSLDCEDPEIFWDMILLTPSDFGIQSVSIQYSDKTKTKFKLNQITSKITLSGDFRSDLTVNFPRQEKDIGLIQFEHNFPLKLFIHERNMLDYLSQGSSLEFADAYSTNKSWNSGINARVSYRAVTKIPSSENGCILTNQSYSYSDCVYENFNEVSLSRETDRVEILVGGAARILKI